MKPKIRLKEQFHILSDFSAEPGQSILSMQIGEKRCCFAITDNSCKKIQQLVCYATNEMNESDLNNLFDSHQELHNPFYKVLLNYEYPKSILIPFRYYKYEDAQFLFNNMHGYTGKGIVVSEAIPEWQLYNIYYVPKDIHDWVAKKFPAGKFWHTYSCGIKNLFDADVSGKLQVDFRTDDFTVIVARESKLLTAQTFLYSTPADVVYYLIKICQQFLLSQQDVKLVLSGLIEKESALYKELYQYFKNVEFKNADWQVSGSDEIPLHFFTSLNDLLRCAS